MSTNSRYDSEVKTPALRLTQPDWPPGLGLSAPAVWGGVVQGVPPSGRRSPRREDPHNRQGRQMVAGTLCRYKVQGAWFPACGRGAPCSHDPDPCLLADQVRTLPTHTHGAHGSAHGEIVTRRRTAFHTAPHGAVCDSFSLG